MPRSHTEKLLTSLPKVPGASRRQQYSASTKRALVEVATAQFSEHGYGGTSLDAIVAGARVTKGALYHHFSGKQAVFEAVFASVEDDASRKIKAALRGTSDPWEKARAGLREFLEIVQDPAYQRVVIQDGPGDPRLRAVPRAGGALQLRHRPGHRRVGARGVDLRARRADEADLQPDLLRRDVGGRRERLDRRGPQAGRGCASRPRSCSSSRASARSPSRASP